MKLNTHNSKIRDKKSTATNQKMKTNNEKIPRIKERGNVCKGNGGKPSHASTKYVCKGAGSYSFFTFTSGLSEQSNLLTLAR